MSGATVADGRLGLRTARTAVRGSSAHRRRGSPVMSAVWAHMIVVVAPSGEYATRMSESLESGLVQAFIAQTAYEALGEGVLLRFAWLDVMPGDAGATLPFKHRS